MGGKAEVMLAELAMAIGVQFSRSFAGVQGRVTQAILCKKCTRKISTACILKLSEVSTLKQRYSRYRHLTKLKWCRRVKVVLKVTLRFGRVACVSH